MLAITKMREAYASEYQKKIYDHPFIASIMKTDALTKETYVSYLVETYHLVTQTPLFLSLAAANTITDDRLRNFFLNLAVEERGHNNLCLKDLKVLGVDAERVKNGLPKLGAWTMISQCHYLARHNPVGILGFAVATEGLGAELAGNASKSILDKYDFSKNATSFLKVHGYEDQEHYKEVCEMFESYAKDAQNYELMKTIWQFTIIAYSQLFTDVALLVD